MSVAVATLITLRALPGAALQRSSRLLMSAIVVPTPPAPFVSVDRHSAFLDDMLVGTDSTNTAPVSNGGR